MNPPAITFCNSGCRPEYDPEEYNLLLKPILNGMADGCGAAALSGSQPHRILFFWHSIGNKLPRFKAICSRILTSPIWKPATNCLGSDIVTVALREQRFGFGSRLRQNSTSENIRIYEGSISLLWDVPHEEGKKLAGAMVSGHILYPKARPVWCK